MLIKAIKTINGKEVEMFFHPSQLESIKRQENIKIVREEKTAQTEDVKERKRK